MRLLTKIIAWILNFPHGISGKSKDKMKPINILAIITSIIGLFFVIYFLSIPHLRIPVIITLLIMSGVIYLIKNRRKNDILSRPKGRSILGN